MNLTLIVIALVLSCCVTVIIGQVDCTSKVDGAYGYGCRAYTNCTGGVGTPVDCDWPNEAYDYRIGQCVSCALAPYPCCERFNCTGRGYKRFAISPDCTYFYTCYQNRDFGASPCNTPPDNKVLVFDEALQHCNWKNNVPTCSQKL